MKNPKTIEVYRSGWMGSEVSSISADGSDYSPKSKEGKRLLSLVYPDRNGVNPGLYTRTSSTSLYAKFEIKA